MTHATPYHGPLPAATIWLARWRDMYKTIVATITVAPNSTAIPTPTRSIGAGQSRAARPARNHETWVIGAIEQEHANHVRRENDVGCPLEYEPLSDSRAKLNQGERPPAACLELPKPGS